MARPRSHALQLKALSRAVAVCVGALPVVLAAHQVSAGEVLDHVRRDGVVRCTAEQRPPVAMPRPDGGIDGLAVGLCRAVAIAVLGPKGRVAFMTDAPEAAADVVFLAGENAAAHQHLAPGPVLFVDRLAILVPQTSPVHSKRDLAGETVCLMIGSPEQSALETMLRDFSIDITRFGFEEAVEMRDAYAVGRCRAMVGPWNELAGWLGPLGVNRLASRLLRDPLGFVPVTAATDTRDPDWSAIVSWVALTLPGNEADAMPPAGVRPGWLEGAGAVVGAYRALAQAAAAGRY